MVQQEVLPDGLMLPQALCSVADNMVLALVHACMIANDCYMIAKPVLSAGGAVPSPCL